MSWDSYIDYIIAQAGKGNADKGCIIGLSGSRWTSIDHPNAFKLTDTEIKKIADCFKLKDFSSMTSMMAADGILCEGVSYHLLTIEEVHNRYTVRAKKDAEYITMQMSKTAVVIGHCPEGGQPGSLSQGVAVTAEYLVSLNM